MAELKIKTTDGNNAVTLAGPASGADVTLKLPTAAGSADQYLKTDGSNGQLSFATVASDKLTHSGTDRVVATGDVKTYTDTLVMRNAANNSDIATYEPTGIDWYHSGTKVAETSANGIAFPSGKGIDFSATGNAGGMSSELLDTYEEGTWTPTVDYGTVVVDDARYVKIGQVCHVKCQLKTFSDTTGGYDVNISLPFSAIDIGSGGGNCCFGGVAGRYITAPSGGSGNMAPYVGNNSSNMSIRLTSSGNWDGLTYSDLQGSDSVLLVGMTYWSD